MGYTTWKIEKVPFTGTSFSTGDTETVTEYFDPILSVNLGDGKDSFSFKMPNGRGQYNNYFGNADKINIYRVVNNLTVPTTTEPKMVGIVRDIPNEYTGRKRQLKIKGYNFSESLMEALVFVDGTTKTPPEVLEEAINSIRSFNDNFSVTWKNSNPTSKLGGGAFPVVGKRYFYVPMKKVLEELSTSAYTDDGQYYWYVNESNEIVWKKGQDYTTGTFSETTDKFLSLKVGRDTKDVKNYLIVKGGTTPSGRIIQTYVPDYSSIAKNGFKFYIIVDENKYASEKNEQDIAKSYGNQGSPDRYPNLSTSFITTWRYFGKARTLTNGTALINNSQVTINTGNEGQNKVDYNEAIYWAAYESLVQRAKSILETTSKGRIEVEIAKRPWQTEWGLGQVIACTLLEFGSVQKEFRVQEIQYSTNIDTYTLKEDIGTL